MEIINEKRKNNKKTRTGTPNRSHKAMADRIKARRKALKFTQEQFAELIGISSSSYTRIENAFQKPSLDTLIKISQNLKISLDYIIFGSESRKNEKSSKSDIIDALFIYTDKEKLSHTVSVLDKLIKAL
ncbi:MAG: helix-turn-helix transcriptional regulator [Oscillospiraceae bacterium]|jgi:transcriptional regulator with XRE-family HTH domain|nr:helix-turn-helix transcriptional regulator [Oscillospiraceae bacterium]